MNFLLAIVLVLALAKILSELTERVGLVSILGEFTAGLILGISLLNLVQAPEIKEFATMGVILLMFLAGYEETDAKYLMERKKNLSLIAAGGLLGTILVLFLIPYLFLNFSLIESLIFAFAFGLTDVAVGAKSLISTGKANTEMGESLLGVAVIDTISGIILLAIGVTLISASSFYAIGETVGGIALFFVLILAVGKFLPRVIKESFKMESEKFVFSIAFVSVFLLAFIAEELHLASVIGAYFAGIILQKSGELEAEQFSQTMESIAYGFFVPIFFAWMGLQTDFTLIFDYLKISLLICGLSLGVKFSLTFLSSKLMGNNNKKSAIFGLGLIPKGADNLIVLAIGSSLGVLSGQTGELMSVSMVLVIVFSVLISSTLLKYFLKD